VLLFTVTVALIEVPVEGTNSLPLITNEDFNTLKLAPAEKLFNLLKIERCDFLN